MAKNMMRKCFDAVLDPPPKARDVDLLWKQFQSQCAYCGKSLIRALRQGHLDHLRARSAGGTNSIHNHVLACGPCNGDEKREESWESFLSKKASGKVLAARRRAIIRWMSQDTGTPARSESTKAAQAAVKEALRAFDQAVAMLRQVRAAQQAAAGDARNARA